MLHEKGKNEDFQNIAINAFWWKHGINKHNKRTLCHSIHTFYTIHQRHWQRITNYSHPYDYQKKQSAHPPSDKFINLVNNARIPWSNNNGLKDEIQKILENCSICRIYRKTAPRSVLGLAKATLFQETGAMDFKFYHGKMSYISLIFILDYLSQPLFWIKTLIPSSRLSLEFGFQSNDFPKNSEQITEENSHTMNIYNSVKA